MRSFAWTMLCTPPLTPLIVRWTAYDFHPWVRQHARHPRHVKRHLRPGQTSSATAQGHIFRGAFRITSDTSCDLREIRLRWGRVELVFQPAPPFVCLWMSNASNDLDTTSRLCTLA